MLVLGCQCEVLPLKLNSPYCFLLKWFLLAPAASLLPLLCSPCFARAVVPPQAVAFFVLYFFFAYCCFVFLHLLNVEDANWWWGALLKEAKRARLEAFRRCL